MTKACWDQVSLTSSHTPFWSPTHLLPEPRTALSGPSFTLTEKSVAGTHAVCHWGTPQERKPDMLSIATQIFQAKLYQWLTRCFGE